MDSLWPSALYSPTTIDSIRMDLSKIRRLREELQSSTHALMRRPYDVTLWLQRAQCLLDLQWPELALGDAHKAEILLYQDFGAMGRPDMPARDSRGVEVALAIQIKEMLCAAFAQLKDRYLLNKTCRRAQSEYPEERYFLSCTESLGDSVPTLYDCGMIQKRTYPWMQPDSVHMVRKALTIDLAQQAISECSGGRCRIKTNTMGLGVFAVQNIQAGETIMLEEPYLASHSDMGGRCGHCCKEISIGRFAALPCCRTTYCTETCARSAGGMYHCSICKRDFGRYRCASRVSGFERDAEDNSRDGLLLKFFATKMHQAPDLHPLQHPAINQLSAAYGGSCDFDYYESVVVPFAILLDLGADIFTPSWDTWVIQVILDRLRNNWTGEGGWSESFHGIYRSFAFFNHSCKPNVDWTGDGSKNALALDAKRFIAAGEELFISYDKRVTHRQRADRWEALQSWMPEGCRCTKCQTDPARETRSNMSPANPNSA